MSLGLYATLQCSIFNGERRGTLQSEMALTCLWGYVPRCSAPYLMGKEGTLQSEMALTCLWCCVARCSAPRGKPHILDVPQQLRDGVQCDRHNHTASCPSQTGGACKETSGSHTLLIIFVPKYSPLFLYDHLSFQFFCQIIMQFLFECPWHI
jgi:hypothetical protein